mmetsp:Transcript_51227/g.109044  ORF Transcript_51227/g.109044 Transcript_51227/m.109044 type:complete len:236 (+) Transcript_51227:619-1326(+)
MPLDLRVRPRRAGGVRDRGEAPVVPRIGALRQRGVPAEERRRPGRGVGRGISPQPLHRRVQVLRLGPHVLRGLHPVRGMPPLVGPLRAAPPLVRPVLRRRGAGVATPSGGGVRTPETGAAAAGPPRNSRRRAGGLGHAAVGPERDLLLPGMRLAALPLPGLSLPHRQGGHGPRHPAQDSASPSPGAAGNDGIPSGKLHDGRFPPSLRRGRRGAAQGRPPVRSVGADCGEEPGERH